MNSIMNHEYRIILLPQLILAHQGYHKAVWNTDSTWVEWQNWWREPAPCSEGKASPSAAPESRPETSRTGSGSSNLSPAVPRGGGWLGGSWESNNAQQWTGVWKGERERDKGREREREREREINLNAASSSEISLFYAEKLMGTRTRKQ